jgi:RNA polymerase sigma-B factor
MAVAGSKSERRERHLTYAQGRDPVLRAELVDRYRGLCHSLAARFASGSPEIEDLVQQANLALLKALDRFDPDRDVEFTTYAWSTISGELKRYLRDHAWRMRVPRSVKETYLLAVTERDELRLELGREPTHLEIATRCVTSERTIDDAFAAETARRPASLEAAPRQGRAAPPTTPNRDYDRVEDRQVVNQLLQAVPARSREILRLHFFEEMTQPAIAGRLGISQSHVSRLLRSSLSILRKRAQLTTAP